MNMNINEKVAQLYEELWEDDNTYNNYTYASNKLNDGLYSILENVGTEYLSVTSDQLIFVESEGVMLI